MRSRRYSIRRWLFWILIAAFVWLAVSRFTEAERLVAALVQGEWPWVLMAALAQAISYALLALVFQASFAAAGVRSRWGHLVLVTLGAVFVNTLAPSGGVAGTALYADDAARQGESPARAAAATLIASVADFAAFALVLVVGFVYLFGYHDLTFYEVGAAVVLLVMTAGQALFLFLGFAHPQLLRHTLSWLERLIDRAFRWIKRRSPLGDGWALRTASDLAGAARTAWTRPWQLGRAVLVSLALHAVNLGSLYCLFRAFHQPVPFAVLVAGYVVAILFLNVSPIPQGVGIVEGTMTLVFVSLHIPTATALLATLAFRGLSFWLPLVAGFLVLRRIEAFHRSDSGWKG